MRRRSSPTRSPAPTRSRSRATPRTSVTATAVYPGYTARTVEVVVGSSAGDAGHRARRSPRPAPRRATVNRPTVPVGDVRRRHDCRPAGRWSSATRPAASGRSTTRAADGNLTGGDGGFADRRQRRGRCRHHDRHRPDHADARPHRRRRAGAARSTATSGTSAAEDFTDVDVSIDGGTTWTNVYHQVDSRRGPTVEDGAADAGRQPGQRQAAVPLLRHVRLVVAGRQRARRQPTRASRCRVASWPASPPTR